MENIVLVACWALVVFLVGHLTGLLFDFTEKWVAGTLVFAGFAVISMCFMTFCIVTPNALVDEYYLPCEIVAYNDTYTYFGTVDSASQELFAVETGNHIWPDDVPYLLYMDGKGTKDVKDDEVLAVWRTD